MNLPINRNDPTIMHIDLNSCFATAEQQAYPPLRGKPIVVAAYETPNGCVVAPSIEAKRYGIKTGMTVRDAKLLCRGVIVRDPDPELIRDIHLKFRNVLRNYSPVVTPKSIDELIIDFEGTLTFHRGLVDIAKEIKQEIRKHVGEWISCNIGIATNRFLAKLAASLHKPDGLDVITHENLLDVYASRTLIDLNGINTRFQAHLNANGIFTPMDFFEASSDVLQHNVFKSIIGYHWFMRLRGWELDAIEWDRKSYGQSYALKSQTNDKKELSRLMMKLCEKMGRRLRKNGYTAQGIHVTCIYTDMTYWHMGRMVHMPLYTTPELFTKAMWVLNHQPVWKPVRELAVSCYHLTPTHPEQLDLFDMGQSQKRAVADAVDKVNNKYGEFVLTPALMMGMDELILDRISYGNIKDIEDVYSQITQ